MVEALENVDLYFSVYRFILLPEDTIKMPIQNKGNVIRGALGRGLRALVCIDRYSKDCLGCPYKSSCAYFIIFSPSELAPIKRMKNLPRGFVVKPPLDLFFCYSQKAPMNFDLVLIGNHIGTLPWFIVALNNIGKVGIGYNKGKFSISSISIWNGDKFSPIYDKETKIVMNQQRKITVRHLMKNIKEDPTEVTINFLTPTRIKYNPTGRRGDSILLKQPEFHHIIRRLRDRVSILSKLYCGEQLNVDYDPIVESAKSIKVKDSDLTWHHQTRKSRTMFDSSGQRATQDQSGFTGTISFVGELRQFMPLLLLGQYIHIGEDTTFGSGWYVAEFK